MVSGSNGAGRFGETNQLKGLTWMIGLSQAIGITMVVLIGVLLNQYLGGFAWDGSGKEFNMHPLCMVCGMVFLYGEAIMIYRVFRQTDKLKTKLLHGGLLLFAFFSAIVGLVAVVQFHNANHIANFYSLHSWFGLTTFLLFALQLIFGFLCFLLPGARASLRAFYLPIHQYWGGSILVLAGISCISGLNEKMFFKLKNDYQKLPPAAVLANMCGLVIIAFILCVLFIVQRSEWKRQSHAEGEQLSVHFRTLTSRSSEDSD